MPAVASVALMVLLAVNPTALQDLLFSAESIDAPILRAGATFDLNAASVVKPAISGSFSLYEEDGVWLEQGDGHVAFTVSSSDPAEAVEFAVRALSPGTTLEILVPQTGLRKSFVVDDGSTILGVPIPTSGLVSLAIRCSSGPGRPDLGRDVRDLCAKFYSMRLVSL